jgi:hypothetical protein
VADDVHIVQHFNHELRAPRQQGASCPPSVQHLLPLLLAASGTTALGLFAGDDHRRGGRQFGIGAGVGPWSTLMSPCSCRSVDALKPETDRPQERTWLMQRVRVSRWLRSRAGGDGCSRFACRLESCGCTSTRTTSTSCRRSPAASVGEADRRGAFSIYSQCWKVHPTIAPRHAQAEELRLRLQRLPFVKKVVSVADYTSGSTAS